MNMSLPSISIVTCSYQQARFLEQTIRSVRDQDYPNLEYLVIDGGSTDGSKEIIERHASALAYWVSEKDRGQSHALMKGFARTTGEICGWLCSDDLLLPGALHRVGRFFQKHPEVDAVFGNSIWIDIDGKPIRPKREPGFNRFVFLHDFNYVPQPSMYWRRHLYDEVGGIRPYFRLAMDTDLWERFSQRARIEHIPHYLSCMRFYAEQKMNNLSMRPRDEMERLLVRRRGGPYASSPALRPLLHLTGKAMRIVTKGLAGGYTSQVPSDLLPWLNDHATPAKQHPYHY